MYIFSFGSYSLGPLVSDRILTVRLATHDSVGRGQDDRWEAAVLRWVWRADDLYSLWYSSKWCLLMLGQVGPNIKSTALTWHEWAPNNKVTLCRGAQSHNLTAITKLVFFHFGLASNTVCGFVDTVAWLVCQRVMYYVCIAYYPENDIRWRLMAYRYFETYMFSTGRNTTNSKNTTYFWFGGDNKPRGFLPSNIIQFVFMALACIFFLLYASFHWRRAISVTWPVEYSD